jgi:formylglycine-generating enzyme required for sulfatase activity
MVEVKPGAFRMGNVGGVGDEFEQSAHDVMIQKPFKLGKYEATFDQYDRFAVATGKPLPHDQDWGRGRRPVINVSWEDARDFAGWLSKQSGKRYRLPSEAEWEYAARSGGKDEIWAGTKNETELKEYAWYSGTKTQEIGGKKPNGLGAHDMSGNVWEWVEDCWHANYTDAPSDGRAWKEETGGQCGRRVGRGGSWYFTPEVLRSSLRGWSYAGHRYNDIGFRLAQDLP